MQRATTFLSWHYVQQQKPSKILSTSNLKSYCMSVFAPSFQTNISLYLRNTFIKLECKTRYLISSFIIFIRIIVIQNWCYTYKKYNTSIFISTKHVVSCLCIMIDMVGLHKWCANRSFGTHCGHRVLKKTPGLEALCFKNFNFVFISIIVCASSKNVKNLVGHLAI